MLGMGLCLTLMEGPMMQSGQIVNPLTVHFSWNGNMHFASQQGTKGIWILHWENGIRPQEINGNGFLIMAMILYIDKKIRYGKDSDFFHLTLDRENLE